MRTTLLTQASILALAAGTTMAQVEHGVITVVENDGGDTASSVTATRTSGAGSWTITCADRGDISTSLGGDGVMIATVFNDGRSEPSVTEGIFTDTVGPITITDGYFATGQAIFDGTWSIAVNQASTVNSDVEVNTDVTFAWFPIVGGNGGLNSADLDLDGDNDLDDILIYFGTFGGPVDDADLDNDGDEDLDDILAFFAVFGSGPSGATGTAWMGGYGFNSTDNSMAWDTFVGNGFTLVTQDTATFATNEIIDFDTGFAPVDTTLFDDPDAIGTFAVSMPGTDLRRDGLIFASTNFADDGNYAMVVQQTPSGGYNAADVEDGDEDGDGILGESLLNEATPNLPGADIASIAYILNRDNGNEAFGEGDDEPFTEQGPMGFVFIPEGTTAVRPDDAEYLLPMGQISWGATALPLGVNTPFLYFQQGDFAVESIFGEEDPGTNTFDASSFRVTVPGESPSTGTLLYQITYGGNEDGTLDQIPTLEPDGNGWVMRNRDVDDEAPDAAVSLVDGVVQGLFTDGDFTDATAQFVFIPNDATEIIPGTPSKAYADRIDDVVAAAVVITELDDGNNSNQSSTGVMAFGSPSLENQSFNRGDIPWAFENVFVNDAEGVTIPTITQAFRDNTGGTGDFTDNTGAGLGIAGFDNGNATTFLAGDGNGGEFNVNVGVAHFPFASGFIGATDFNLDVELDIPATVADVFPVTFQPTGTDATQGVLMVTSWDNDPRFSTVATNGSSFEVSVHEFDGLDLVPSDSVEIGYVYLPFSTSNLVAGVIDASGSTTTAGTGGFSATIDSVSFPLVGSRDVIRLSIPGADARTDGVLLVNGVGSDATVVAYEADASNGDFLVGGINFDAGATFGPVAFQFAFVPNSGLGQ